LNSKSYSFLFFVLYFVAFASTGTFAQIPNVDSLKNILPDSNGEERLSTLNELSFYLREIEQHAAFNYALEAEKLAQKLENKSEEAKAKENLGWIYYRRGKWQKSFDYSKSAYVLSMEANNLEQAAKVMNSMGALYYEQQSYSQAIEQFKNAYAISMKTGDLYTMIRSLNNVAFNFLAKNELDSSKYYALKAIETNVNAGSPYLLSFSNRVLGDIFLQRNQLDSAEIIYLKALENGRIQNLTTFQASVLHRLGKTYLLNGKLENAKSILLEGIELSSNNNLLDELAKSHKYLADYYRINGDYQKAFEEQSKFVVLNDSLVNQASKDRLALMQGMFQDDLDQSELDLLVAQNEHQQTRLEMNRRVMVLIGVASLLILGLLIWLFLLNRNIKKYNRHLVSQKKQIFKQNEDLEAKSSQLQEINQTKNKLFSIVGHDLRGPVGQVKSLVDLLISGQLEKDEFEDLVQNLKKDVDSVYFTLNNTLKWSMAQMEGFKLNKVNFNLADLVGANVRLIKPKLKEKSLDIEYSSYYDDLDIFADRDLIEVVIRNILNNAVKFSKPGDVIMLSADLENDMVVFCIEDQGIGMSEIQINELLTEDYVITNSKLGTNREKGSGLGLQICKEFTRMNGGELLIRSEEGQGTKVCIKVPGSKVLVNN
tara:strand:+ start:43804 stop:45765 length:1962 start_codon:yes stop_codon:yes gene_type:complete